MAAWLDAENVVHLQLFHQLKRWQRRVKCVCKEDHLKVWMIFAELKQEPLHCIMLAVVFMATSHVCVRRHAQGSVCQHRHHRAGCNRPLTLGQSRAPRQNLNDGPVSFQNGSTMILLPLSLVAPVLISLSSLSRVLVLATPVKDLPSVLTWI